MESHPDDGETLRVSGVPSQFFYLPTRTLKLRDPIATKGGSFGIKLTGQRNDHPLASGAQLHDLVVQARLVRMGCPDALVTTITFDLPTGHQQTEIRGKTGGRPRPTKIPTDIIVATTLGDTLPRARDERSEGHTRVIVVATQLRQIEIQRHLGVA